jgi:anti-anti-sigma regulatory factor
MMVEKVEKKISVPLSGEVTVRTIGEVHGKLLAALSDADVDIVAVDCSGIDATDLTLVQLIESARQTAVAAGKTVVVPTPVSQPLLDVLARGGFLAAEGESGNFWRNVAREK